MYGTSIFHSISICQNLANNPGSSSMSATRKFQGSMCSTSWHGRLTITIDTDVWGTWNADATYYWQSQPHDKPRDYPPSIASASRKSFWASITGETGRAAPASTEIANHRQLYFELVLHTLVDYWIQIVMLPALFKCTRRAQPGVSARSLVTSRDMTAARTDGLVGLT